MRGTWDDLNRRLAGAILALDLHDALVIGDVREEVKPGLFRKPRPVEGPRRYVQVTAARDVFIAECVGSTSFGGEWEMTPEQEEKLLRQGWEKPWSPKYTTFQREAPLAGAPRLALATVRALELLGSEMETLEVTLIREEPED